MCAIPLLWRLWQTGTSATMRRWPISMLEQSGRAFVIRPPILLEILHGARDPAQLRRVYETGRAVAQNPVDKIAAYVEECKAATEE